MLLIMWDVGSLSSGFPSDAPAAYAGVVWPPKHRPVEIGVHNTDANDTHAACYALNNRVLCL